MNPPAPPPPEQQIMQLIMGKFISQTLGAVSDLGVPDLLKDGPRTAEELARHTGSNADALHRALRALCTVGVFAEGPGKTFVLTPVSELLRSDNPRSMRAMARWIGSDPGGWKAWGMLHYSLKTGRPAIDQAFDVKGPFEYFAKFPESGAVFDKAMTSFSTMSAHAVAAAYDFSGIERMVDVGGSQGVLLHAVRERFPNLRGINFDLPQVIERAKQAAAAGGVSDVEYVAGDFFEGVPAGANAYIMKHIIHDWSDDLAVRIFERCREAMAPGGRVLVVEQLISSRPEATPAKWIDLEMLVMTEGGRERTPEEFGALFERAGLTLARVVPTESPVVVLEAFAK